MRWAGTPLVTATRRTSMRSRPARSQARWMAAWMAATCSSRSMSQADGDAGLPSRAPPVPAVRVEPAALAGRAQAGVLDLADGKRPEVGPGGGGQVQVQLAGPAVGDRAGLGRRRDRQRRVLLDLVVVGADGRSDRHADVRRVVEQGRRA